MKRSFALYISGVILLAIVTAGCSSGLGGYGVGSGNTPTGTVVDLNSIEGSTNVAVNSKFQYTFSKDVDTSTVTTSTFFIMPTLPADIASPFKGAYDPTTCNVASAVTATVDCYTGAKCVLTPSSNLSASTGYTACLTTGILYADNTAFGGFTAAFTTASGGASLTAPTLADIVTALKANTTYGMVPGLALSSITLPVCTDSGGSAATNVTYTISGASWLSLNSSTRVLSLASGSTIPTDANTATTVAYTCTDASDSTVTASRSFTVNDADGGGVIDNDEYTYGEVPLVGSHSWYWLNPANVNLYRVGTTTFRIPTGITKATAGMDATNAADDTADFDGDVTGCTDPATGKCGTNVQEVTYGSDIFIAVSGATFPAVTDKDTDDGTNSVATGDFNADGYPDIAAANSDSNSVDILINNGDGTFKNAVNYPLGNGPQDITVGDFNNDGVLDIALANTANNKVSIMMGDGDGTFTVSEATYAVANTPTGIVTADFNGDGNLDLAVACGSEKVSILIGAGTGAFAVSETTYTVGTAAYRIATGDFNGDGYLDLAVSNYGSANVSILLGVGNGTFGAAVNKTVGTGPDGIVVGDFNGDGVLDLAVQGDVEPALAILIGVGDGTFANAVTYTSDGLGGITGGDLDGDGDIDLAVTNEDEDKQYITILLGAGDGTFTKVATTYHARDGCYGITAADFDNDGALDLATADNDGVDSAISILLNQ